MTPNDRLTLQNVDSMERYNHWIVSLFSKYFGKNILEVGSGLGTLSKLLPRQSELTMTDINQDYLAKLKQTNLGVVMYCDIQNPPSSLKKATFETVFSSNVLEHIPDDKLALQNIYDLLKPKGYLLLFLPAKKCLMGELDRQLKHFRRYEKNEFQACLVNMGFRITKIRYFNLIGFFTWWFSSCMLKQKYISPKASRMYDNLLVPLLELEKKYNLPFGQNLMIVAQKL